MMISAENDNLHNVTLFRKPQPKQERTDNIVWECTCGCQEFKLRCYPDRITCAACGEEVCGWHE